jgi:hypothetical protein
MSRKRETITLSLSDADNEALQAIAVETGCTWGSGASISEMMRRIARKELAILEASEHGKTLQSIEDVALTIEAKIDELKAILRPQQPVAQDKPGTAELLDNLIAKLCEIPADPPNWTATTKSQIRYGVKDALSIALQVQASLGLSPKLDL